MANRKSSKRGGARPNTGGSRPGSGRKPRAVKFADLKTITDAELESIIREDVPSALRELVRGHYKSEPDKHGGERVYSVSPNITAIVAVLDRGLGKVTDKIEHTGDITSAISVTLSEEKITKPTVEGS